MMKFTNISDLIDPNDKQGMSYREVNNSLTHKYKVGDEVLSDGDIVMVHHLFRDCDGTPLYRINRLGEISGGYPEDCLLPVGEDA